MESSPIATKRGDLAAERLVVPTLEVPAGDEQSTQAAFGKVLLALSKSGGPLVERIVTTSPDVTVSTNLGAWVNQRASSVVRSLRTYSPELRSRPPRSGGAGRRVITSSLG